MKKIKPESIIFIVIFVAVVAGVVIISKPSDTMKSTKLLPPDTTTAISDPTTTDNTTMAQNTTTTLAPTSIEPRAQKDKEYSKYKEIADPAGYVNTGGLPITISQYVGKKVILLDFLTYSCINCQRTFPYLNAWYSKYEDKGLVIIGIHTPEFAFEHDQKNVEDAMKQFGIKFPVVLDNNYGTWNAYGNEYWPRKYLIDIDGYVVYDHIGEGEYDVTESKIVDLLNERAYRMNQTKVSGEPTIIPATMTSVTANESPETYIGSARSQYEYTGSDSLPKDQYMLGGSWDRSDSEYAKLTSDTGTISYHFYANKVHLVASAPEGADASILLDGKPIFAAMSGADVNDSTILFNESRLYTLVDLKGNPAEHTLQINIHKKGLQAYAFTFS